MKKIKIVHIITGLNKGGAEMMLYKLLQKTDRNIYDITVISMMEEGPVGLELKRLGIEVHSLNLKRGFFNIKSIQKAVSICKGADIIQSWMYHANLFSIIVSKFVNHKKLIWGIHHSNLESVNNKKKTLIIVKICALLSKYADTIVCCSESSYDVHKKWGYDPKKLIVIPNGFDVSIFNKDAADREKILKEFSISSDKKIIINVARWDILKDYPNLIKAISIIEKKRNDIVCLLCGSQINYDNQELACLLKKFNVADHTIKLLGIRDDIPTLMASGDIYVLSSKGEGFPNVLGEAMACELPCVVTDVGDCAYIVGDTGIVVEKENPEALAEGIEKMLDFSDEDMDKLKSRARERIIENFDINKVSKQYIDLYQ